MANEDIYTLFSVIRSQNLHYKQTSLYCCRADEEPSGTKNTMFNDFDIFINLVEETTINIQSQHRLKPTTLNKYHFNSYYSINVPKTAVLKSDFIVVPKTYFGSPPLVTKLRPLWFPTTTW